MTAARTACSATSRGTCRTSGSCVTPPSRPGSATTRPSGRPCGAPLAVVRADDADAGAGRRPGVRRARRPGRRARRRHRAVRRRQRRRRLRRRRPRADEPRSSRSTRVERLAVVQPGVVNDDLRAAVRRARPLVPAGPGELAVVDDRRQRRHQRRRRLLRQVRRHPRLRARRSRSSPAPASSSGSAGGRPRASRATTSRRCWSAPRARSASSPRSPCGCARCAPPERTVVGYFDSLVDAGEAVAAVAPSRARCPSALELVDRHCLRGGRRLEEHGPRGRRRGGPARPRRRRRAPAGDAEAERVLRLLRGGRRDVGRPVDRRRHEAEALFAARRLAYPALERLGPVLTEDVCVPEGRGAGDARAASSAIADAARRRSSPTSPTPATATCTRCIITPPGDDGGPGPGPGGVRARSSPRRSPSAARSPASTASACSSATASPPSSRPAVLAMHRAMKDGALDPKGHPQPGKGPLGPHG